MFCAFCISNYLCLRFTSTEIPRTNHAIPPSSQSSNRRIHTHSETEGLRCAKSRSADADCIPSPKRKVSGSQSSNRKQCRLHTHSKTEGLRCAKLQSKAMQTAYPLRNGRFAVRKITLGGCRLHTLSKTEGQRFAKLQSKAMQTAYPLQNGRSAVRKTPIESNADHIPTPKRKVCGSQNRARRMQHEVRSRFTPEHGEGVCFST